MAVVREDLVDTMNAWVVKAVNSPLRANYSSVADKPVVVFFRKKRPVLYEGT